MPRPRRRQDDADDDLVCPVCGGFHRSSDDPPGCSGAPAGPDDGAEEEEEDEEAEDEFLPCCACDAEPIPLWLWERGGRAMETFIVTRRFGCVVVIVKKDKQNRIK